MGVNDLGGRIRLFISHFVTAPAWSSIVRAAMAHVRRATAGWSLPLAVGWVVRKWAQTLLIWPMMKRS